MKYLDFVNKFEGFNSVSLQEIKNYQGGINSSQISNWKKKGLLKTVKRGFFVLPNFKIDPHLLANELNYSYISTEYALSYYQMIPDIASSITSVSKNRNEKFDNEFGKFIYKKISKHLFFDYILMKSEVDGRNFRIATPEKALFDLVYLRSDLREETDFESLRLTLPKNLDIKKIKKFVELVAAPQIKKRLVNFVSYLYAISK